MGGSDEAGRAGGRPVLRVAAGILRDGLGRVLIAQRPAAKHAGGYWEFPGGKLAPGETPEAALRRELAEELGITMHAAEPFLDLAHDYTDRRVLLHVLLVTAWDGEPHGLEGQPLRWAAAAELAATDILPADRPVITALTDLALAAGHAS